MLVEKKKKKKQLSSLYTWEKQSQISGNCTHKLNEFAPFVIENFQNFRPN